MLSFHSPFEKNKMKFALVVTLHVLFMTVSLQVMTKRAEDLKRMWRRCLFSVGWPPSNLWGRCLYIDQLHNPSFPIGLVMTESELLDQFKLT